MNMRPNEKLVMVVVLTIITGCSATNDNSANDPAGLLSQILVADDFDTLIAPIHYLRHHGNDRQIKQFTTLVLGRVDSDKLLNFKPDWNSDEYFGFTYRNQPISSCGLTHAMDEYKRQRQKIRGQDHIGTAQDLGIEGGRCCWALERLYGLYLPPMLLGLESEKRARFAEETRNVVRQHMTLRPSAARHVQLSESERVKIIARSDLNPSIVYEMSTDESPNIRKMVAEHPNCFPYLFHGYEFLRSDPDPDVASAAGRRAHRSSNALPKIMVDRSRRQLKVLAEVDSRPNDENGSGTE